ncbi:periplasmic heavy metal sensor [Mangrovimicrobium sediminis]|uniref:Periplasmic heavy metal sensor n=1 Tax=Mangrovimicrobium sediminis TaxID=2562682 RepID=A0A4Z0M5G7_9GAMM|nr:Spy/CpxP family protein refolding chaperone [Haliea sp. SAOS-164]TGD74686.1 periplasmic heavy metal sensor [Haliea sp. SAOS-164]
MKQLISRILPGTVLSAIMLFSAAAWSGPHGNPHMGPDDSAPFMARMVDELDLSDEQRTTIQGLVTDAREAGKADHQRMREIHAALKDMRTSFDEDKARALTDELGEISARMAYRMSSTGAGVYAQLTPEQQTELDARMEQMQARAEKRMGKRRDWQPGS